MSSQSWNAIPEARRKALAQRLRRQSTYDSSDEDVDLDTIDEAIAKPYRSSSSDLDRKTSSGSGGHDGGAKGKSPSNSFQEQDVDDDVVKDHDRKLQRLEMRIEKLLRLNENLSERNQKLEDLLVKVAEKVGISHGLEKRSSPARH